MKTEDEEGRQRMDKDDRGQSPAQSGTVRSSPAHPPIPVSQQGYYGKLIIWRNFIPVFTRSHRMCSLLCKFSVCVLCILIALSSLVYYSCNFFGVGKNFYKKRDVCHA
jgi:hypothetical protein